MTPTLAPEYVLARSVLLDVLDALGDQARAMILVGAQAVYIHTGDAELTAAPMTTDADLMIDVDLLVAEPEITGAMTAAGFIAGGRDTSILIPDPDRQESVGETGYGPGCRSRWMVRSSIENARALR